MAVERKRSLASVTWPYTLGEILCGVGPPLPCCRCIRPHKAFAQRAAMQQDKPFKALNTQFADPHQVLYHTKQLTENLAETPALLVCSFLSLCADFLGSRLSKTWLAIFVLSLSTTCSPAQTPAGLPMYYTSPFGILPSTRICWPMVPFHSSGKATDGSR